MKTTPRSIAINIPILFFFLLLSLDGHAVIASLDHQAKHTPCRQTGLTATNHKAKKAGLFTRLAAKRFMKQAKPQQAQKASRRARAGFGLLIASYALPLLLILLGASDLVVFAVFLPLVLASIIISILVLAKEDNPRSKMLASIILLLTGIGLIQALFAYIIVLKTAD